MVRTFSWPDADAEGADTVVDTGVLPEGVDTDVDTAAEAAEPASEAVEAVEAVEAAAEEAAVSGLAGSGFARERNQTLSIPNERALSTRIVCRIFAGFPAFYRGRAVWAKSSLGFANRCRR